MTVGTRLAFIAVICRMVGTAAPLARAQVYGGTYNPPATAAAAPATPAAAVAPAAAAAPAPAPGTPTAPRPMPVTPTTSAAAAIATPSQVKPEEVEQVVAPIALYPDSLLAQILMASTYPLEVVQADRWVKDNPKLKDDAAALNKQTWDPSVKSLCDFPQVLAMMSEKLDWTLKLGDAFIADQKGVMDAVQRLRNKAYAQGNLKTSEQQKVSVQQTPATTTQPAAQVIVVESASPSVVYVPTYNPTVVYGGWPYPSYPPYSYYPPGYVAGTALLSFGVGMAVGAAWGHAWGGCNWGHSEVDIDVDRNVNFNSNIDREAARQNQAARQGERDTRQGERQGNRDTRQTNRQGGASSFQHDPSHRKGVAYKDSATSERFQGAGASRQTSQARDSYRGRAEAGRSDIARGGASDFRGSNARSGSYQGSAGGGRTSAGTTGSRSSGFSGAGSSGSRTRAESSRGQSSRSSSSYSGSRSGGSSGGSRSSGGGSRGGGGGSRGGGGGGRGGGRR